MRYEALCSEYDQWGEAHREGSCSEMPSGQCGSTARRRVGVNQRLHCVHDGSSCRRRWRGRDGELVIPSRARQECPSRARQRCPSRARQRVPQSNVSAVPESSASGLPQSSASAVPEVTIPPAATTPVAAPETGDINSTVAAVPMTTLPAVRCEGNCRSRRGHRRRSTEGRAGDEAWLADPARLVVPPRPSRSR